MFSDIMTIVSKELNRVFTDKKLVFTTFILPAVSLVLIYSVMGIMIKNTMADQEDHISQIAVIGAPSSFSEIISRNEKDYNATFKLEDVKNEQSLKDAVYNGKLDALIVFDQVFDQNILAFKQQGSMPNVDTFYNPTEDYSAAAYEKVTSRILTDFEKQILVKRFGNESFLKAFTVDLGNEKNALAPPEKMSGDILGGLVPFLLSIFLFSGGMGIGIDLITGEKERGTMATLLVTPIKREAIAFGKMLSLAIVSLISTASSLVGMVASFPFLKMAFSNESNVPAQGAGSGASAGNMFVLSPSGIFQFLVLAIFLTLIYVGIICIVSVYANSIKEAGTLITPAYMAVMMLGMVTMFSTKIPPTLAFATPVYGTLMGMKHALSAELTWTMFGLNIIVSAFLVAGIIWAIRQMFNSEKIMFGA
jgi:sodium transport system permease protein